MTATAPALRSGTEPLPPARRWWRVAVVAGLLVAAVWAAAGSHWLEPELSSNLDEQAYLFQADLLAHGHLAVQVPSSPGDALVRNFQPWFAVPTDHGYIFKYNLVWPGVMAVTTALSATRLALGFAFVLFLVGTYAVAVQVLRSRAKALAAAVLVALSPLTIIQSTTLLSYVFFGGLWTLAAASLLRGVDRGDRRFVALTGALGALAFCARPFDAVLTLAPFVVWAGWRLWKDRVASWWLLAWAAAAAAPILVAQAVYNAYVTGVPWRFPYALWSSTDRFGFGWRGLMPNDVPQTYYGPKQAVHALVDNVWALNAWAFGGVVLVALAAVGIWVSRRRGDSIALASLVVVVPAGYVFFWGIANISFLSKAMDRFGPYYFLPLLVPLAAFAVEGAMRVWEWRRWALAVAVVLALALTGVGTASALSTAIGERDARSQPYDVLATITNRTRPALVFFPGDYLGVSVLDRYTLDPDGRGTDRFVVSNGNHDISLVRHYGSLAPYAIVGCNYPGETPLGSEVFPSGEPSLALVTGTGARAQRLHLATSDGPVLTVQIVVDPSATAGAQLEVAAGTTGLVAPVVASADGRATITVTVARAGVTAAGDVGAATPTTLSSEQPLTLRLTSRAAPTDPQRSETWRAPIDVRANAVTVLLPARTFASPDFPSVKEAEMCGAPLAMRVDVDAAPVAG
ncbi:MAG: hypothetical protein ABWY77_03715 [Acidimicrobiia bacterium]